VDVERWLTTQQQLSGAARCELSARSSHQAVQRQAQGVPRLSRDKGPVYPPTVGRPPLQVGTYGRIMFTVEARGKVVARTYFRDFDGRRPEVARWGRTKADAERALKSALVDRTGASGDGNLTGDTRVEILAKRWLADLAIRKRSRECWDLAPPTGLEPVTLRDDLGPFGRVG